MNEKEFEAAKRKYLGLIRNSPKTVALVREVWECQRNIDAMRRRLHELTKEIDESDIFFDEFLRFNNLLPPSEHTINHERWYEYFKVDDPKLDDFLKNLAHFAAMAEQDAVESEAFRVRQEAKRRKLGSIKTEDLEEELRRRRG